MGFGLENKLGHLGTSIFPVMTALANKHNAVNLAQGFPGFPVDPYLIELVNKYMQEGKNQYAPLLGLPKLRAQLSDKIFNLYGHRYNPENEICITASATQGIYTAISAVINEGDEAIIVEPAYDCYDPAILLNKGKTIRSELKSDTYEIDWADVRSKVSSKTRLIIINTPHNPSGTILKAHDLKELQSIVENTNILILSDEVYEHVIFDDETHQSVCRYPDLVKRAFTVYSFGKTYHVTGWRMGYVCAPKELMNLFVSCHQFQVYAVATPFQYAISDYMDNPQVYLHLNEFFQEKRDFFAQCVQGSKFELKQCAGTYFQLLDYSKITDEPDTDFANRLTKEYGIASIPTSVFYQSKRQDQVLRFCFAKDNEELEKGAACLHKV